MGRPFSCPRRLLKMFVQQGRRRVETGGVASGYVEDFDEPTCLREAASAKAGNDAGGLFQHPDRG